jgi:hypothetical protein
MSVLEAPRICFKGEVTWDPIVTNNDDKHYDEATAQPVFLTAANRVQAFRQRAVSDVAKGLNWNPHGTHRARFFNCAVASVDQGGGDDAGDPLVGASVALTGMLVDLEPYGSFSSQIFFDRLSFGVEGGYFLGAARRSRFTARYINFTRNNFNRMIAGVASVVWQTSFAKADLALDADDSGVLQALRTGLEEDDVLGLTVRFNAYRTVYFDDPTLRSSRGAPPPATQAAFAALGAKLGAGGFQPNPARSLLVGVAGLWRRGEAAGEPSERVLRPPVAGSPLGGAFARVDDKALTLDLGNSVAEVDAQLSKQNLGALTIAAVDAAGREVAALGALSYAQYDRAAYERSAGIVSLPLTSAAAKIAGANDLLVRDATGAKLLTEARLRAVPEAANFYRNEGETTIAQFQVYERGAPIRRAASVALYTLAADGTFSGSPQPAVTDSSGRFGALVPASGGAISALVPVVEGADPAPSQFDPQQYTYMYIRTLPADADVAALAPTWDNVFARVLANWAAMAPCMDNWLPLDDEASVKARAAMLKRLTDPARFEDFRFMPVTRDMSAGERTLLYNFLDAAAPAAMAATKPNVLEMSRAARGGGLEG